MAETYQEGSTELLAIHDGTAYLTLGCLTSNSFNITYEVKEVPVTKCDTNPPSIYGDKQTYEAPFEAINTVSNASIASYDALLEVVQDAFDAKELIYFRLTNGSSVKFGAGLIPSIERTAPVEDFVTFSGTIQGSGKLSDTDLVV